MKYLVSFLLSFMIVYLFYLFTVILQKKKYDKFKTSNQVLYFVNKYKINADKIDMARFIKNISLINSFVVAISFTAMAIFNNIYLELLVGVIVLIPVLLLCYHVLGNKLKKECK